MRIEFYQARGNCRKSIQGDFGDFNDFTLLYATIKFVMHVQTGLWQVQTVISVDAFLCLPIDCRYLGMNLTSEKVEIKL